ncbi:MAG: hypothetical protein DME81_07995, partial [Verrucomicrobia bacterium]
MIPTGERSGLQPRIAVTESVSLPDERRNLNELAFESDRRELDKRNLLPFQVPFAQLNRKTLRWEEVSPEQVPGFMEKLSVRKIWGIGEKTEKKLEELGVKTCGELQRFSRPDLVDLFGKFGLDLYDLCRG